MKDVADPKQATNGVTPDKAGNDPVKVVADALQGLQFGTVKVIVQDGVIVRIERTENRQVSCRSKSH